MSHGAFHPKKANIQQSRSNVNQCCLSLLFSCQSGRLKTTRTSWSLSSHGPETAKTKSTFKSGWKKMRFSKTHRWVCQLIVSFIHLTEQSQVTCMWYFKYQTLSHSFFSWPLSEAVQIYLHTVFSSATSGYFHCWIVVWVMGCLSPM